MNRLRGAVLLALLVCACRDTEPVAPAPSPEPEAAEARSVRRALWVLAEGSHRTLESPERVDALVERATELGVTDLFVQVFRGGRSWFASQHADDAPFRAIARDGDPLRRLVDRAHAAGLRVHAWFNCLRVERREAPPLDRLGPAAVMVDRRGRSLLDYPDQQIPPPDGRYLAMGTPGYWLDPAVPGVIEHLEATLADLVAAVPDLDGLHLDVIRHPEVLPLLPGSRFDVGLDFGYGQASRARFEREHGRFERGQAWDDFRRERVDELVRRLDARLPPRWEHSAAVIAYADRAYMTMMQDWRRWLEEGWIDFAVAMSYTADDRLLRYQVGELRGGVAGERVWLGLGTWLMLGDPDRIARQIEIASAVLPAGIALFSYDALTERPAAFAGVRWPQP
jgi:uncharacterized lipoprotein YddW (UPF0748 family)